MLASSCEALELLEMGMSSDSGRGRGFALSVSVPVLFKVDARVADANECVSDSICVNVKLNGREYTYVVLLE